MKKVIKAIVITITILIFFLNAFAQPNLNGYWGLSPDTERFPEKFLKIEGNRFEYFDNSTWNLKYGSGEWSLDDNSKFTLSFKPQAYNKSFVTFYVDSPVTPTKRILLDIYVYDNLLQKNAYKPTVYFFDSSGNEKISIDTDSTGHLSMELFDPLLFMKIRVDYKSSYNNSDFFDLAPFSGKNIQVHFIKNLKIENLISDKKEVYHLTVTGMGSMFMTSKNGDKLEFWSGWKYGL